MWAAEVHMDRLEQCYHGILHDLQYGRRGLDQRCGHPAEALADMADRIADSSRLRQAVLLVMEPREAARMGRPYRLDKTYPYNRYRTAMNGCEE
jgi:hypothetical protein